MLSTLHFLGHFSRLCLFAAVALFLGSSFEVYSQTSNKMSVNQVPPIRGDEEIQIEMPDSSAPQGAKLRVVNLANAKEFLLDVPSEKIFRLNVKGVLVDQSTPLLIPEISILVYRKGDNRMVPSSADIRGFGATQSLAFDQPIWRRMGFRVHSLPSGGTRLSLDPNLRTKVLTVAQARSLNQRTNAVEAKLSGSSAGGDPAAPKLAQILPQVSLLPKGRVVTMKESWDAHNNREFTKAIQYFSSLLEAGGLTPEQRAQAHLGKGMSHFHKDGCGSFDKDFSLAERDPKNEDDVAYYRGLCAIEEEKFDDAENQFSVLVKRESKIYGDKSRFYMGVVSESRGDFDRAESTYLDLIDFSSDSELVVLAKERVEAVKRARAEDAFRRNWFSALAIMSLGYDSNVFSLPPSIDPGLGVSGNSDMSTMLLASLDFRLPYWSKIEHRLRYTFLMMHYLTPAIASQYDIQSHDVSSTAGFGISDRDMLTPSGGFNSVYKGPIQGSSQYINSWNAGIEWQRILGKLEEPSARLLSTYQFSSVMPQTPQTEGFDITAYSHVVKFRHQNFSKPNVFGPGLDIEWRRAVGAQNTLFAGTLVGFWDRPIGPESWGLALSQEGALDLRYFYDSAVADSADDELAKLRKDGTLRYTLAVSRMWGKSLESRLQFVGSLTDSSRIANRYKKAQLNLLVSAFF